jgi:crotonobetainyl-CoA:carnitine CoA-transferase CaiB-like acyl-CoA transferase
MRELQGLRVVEVGTAASVPLVGVMLANLGAEVIKVESAVRPDINRIRPGRPPRPVEETVGDAFPMLHELNAGKKSITLNLKSQDGRQLFARLLDRCDVFIENYAPGWLDRLGLPLAQICASNPRLVVLAASAYGEEGPLSQQRAYAPIMTALSGLEGLIGYGPDDVLGMVATAFSDSNSAYFAMLSVFAGLLERQRSGVGGLIDFSQTEAAVCMTGVAIAEQQLTGQVRSPRGNEHPCFEPHDIFRCAGPDGWVAVSVGSDEQWRGLCDAMNEVTGLRDGRFATMPGRRSARPDIAELITSWTIRRPADDAAGILQRHGVTAAPVIEPGQLAVTEPLRSRGIVDHLSHEEFGEFLTTIKPPWRIGQDMPHAQAVAPAAGSANHDILVGLLGVSEEEFARLNGTGALS